MGQTERHHHFEELVVAEIRCLDHDQELDSTVLVVLTVLALLIILVVLIVCAVVAFRSRHLERKMRERACSRFIVPNSAAQERVVSLEGAQPFHQNTFSTVDIVEHSHADSNSLESFQGDLQWGHSGGEEAVGDLPWRSTELLERGFCPDTNSVVLHPV